MAAVCLVECWPVALPCRQELCRFSLSAQQCHTDAGEPDNHGCDSGIECPADILVSFLFPSSMAKSFVTKPSKRKLPFWLGKQSRSERRSDLFFAEPLELRAPFRLLFALWHHRQPFRPVFVAVPQMFPMWIFGKLKRIKKCKKCLILLVGAPRFELGTPSPPDWCANRAALRSETAATIVIGHFASNIRSPSALSQRKVAIESLLALPIVDHS